MTTASWYRTANMPADQTCNEKLRSTGLLKCDFIRAVLRNTVRCSLHPEHELTGNLLRGALTYLYDAWCSPF